jgi:DNA-binding transcriptional MerR regulator
VNDRPYLSIGEVLELLKHDFPDLSISRIRAFESAGQLELERTASGYRKFYESDISYLRGLLGGAGPAAPGSNINKARAPKPVAMSTDDSEEPPELGPNGELPGDPERRHPAAFQSLRREMAQRSPALPPLPPLPHVSPQGVAATTDASAGAVHDEPLRSIPSEVQVVPVLSIVESTPGHVATASAGAASAATKLTSLEKSNAHSDAHRDAQSDAHSDAHSAAQSGSNNPLNSDASGLNLSLDELVKISGLTNEVVRELESLGLLKGQGVFSAVYYDEDALLTCKLVAAFRQYGVEPRHLRMYKLAADREASFFEQVVTPQLRRKNPDARQSAIDTLGELVRLGEQLRTVALRQVLRSSINR